MDFTWTSWNLAHILPPYVIKNFIKINFNICLILPYTPRSSKWIVSFISWLKLYIIPHVSNSPWFDNQLCLIKSTNYKSSNYAVSSISCFFLVLIFSSTSCSQASLIYHIILKWHVVVWCIYVTHDRQYKVIIKSNGYKLIFWHYVQAYHVLYM